MKCSQISGQSESQEERDERGHGDGDPGDGKHQGPGGPSHRPPASITCVSDETFIFFH